VQFPGVDANPHGAIIAVAVYSRPSLKRYFSRT
jgi:hypothetical protein